MPLRRSRYLAAGLGTACGRMASRTVGAYSYVRKQFGMSIGKFEGVQEALARIGGLTYQLEGLVA